MSRLWLILLAVFPLFSFQKPSPFPEKEKGRPPAAAPAPRQEPRKQQKSADRAEKPEPAQPSKPTATGDTGVATFCGPGMDGRKTATGEVFDSNALTAAHASLPLGSKVKVTNLGNGKSIVVRINDRFRSTRTLILLTRRGAEELDFIAAGSAQVKLEPEK